MKQQINRRAITTKSNARVATIWIACDEPFRINGFKMKVYSATATIPDITNAIGIATYGVVSQTLVAINATYTPIVAKDACAKFGTLVVRYVSVKPILRRAKRLAKIIASENIGSYAKSLLQIENP